VPGAPPLYSAFMRLQDIPYQVDGQEMVGYLAVDDERPGPRPSVLICHEGFGLSDGIRGRAIRLASLGYLAFALDYLGGGRPREDAMSVLGPLMEDRPRIKRIARAGYEVMVGQDQADASRVAVIGYCFGGTMAFELARDGLDVKAVVGFHAGPPAPALDETRTVRAKVLFCLGAADPIIPADRRHAFEAELAEAGVEDWRIELYGGVGHSFTNPKADERAMPGLKYHADADRRSWRSLLGLLEEVFGPV